MEPSHPLVPRAGVHDGVTRGQPVFLHGGHQRLLRRARHAAGDRSSPSGTAAARPMEYGEPIHGSLALELIWTGIPFILAMVMFVWGASVYFALARVPDEALDIYAVGKQWMWKFQHREGQREINELHVPVNTPIRVIITSEDVLHDLYFPSFRTKIDAHPRSVHAALVQRHRCRARITSSARSTAARRTPGMIGHVVVMPQNEYEAWLGGSATEGTLAQRGEKLFTQFACVTCHRADSQGRGPLLNGVFGLDRPLRRRQHRDGRRGLRPRVDSQPDGEGRHRLRAASCRPSRARSARSSSSRSPSTSSRCRRCSRRRARTPRRRRLRRSEVRTRT